MPFLNLDNRHFTAAEKATINSSLATIETILNTKLVNITAEERSKYASVGEQNKLLVNKVKAFRDNQPQLSSPDVDWVEFAADYESRVFIQAVMLRIESFMTSLLNSKILHDADNYTAALLDYDYAKYKMGTNTPGFEVKVNELSQFFNRTGTGNTNKTKANRDQSS